jgi:hypothetical protein
MNLEPVVATLPSIVLRGEVVTTMQLWAGDGAGGIVHFSIAAWVSEA